MWRAMMKFIYVAVAVLGLLSVGHSAPVTNCESLTKPMEIQGGDHLLGKWIILAESTNLPVSKVLTELAVGSAWIKFTDADESGPIDIINIIQISKMFGRCFSLAFNMTFENNTLSVVQPLKSSSVVLLNTGCPDCLVSYSKYNIMGGTLSQVQLLSRRNKVTAAELEEFTKQAECLNLLPPAVLDSEKDLCPEDSQEIDPSYLPNFFNSMSSDVFKLLNQMITSEGGIQRIFQMFSSS